MMIMVKNFIKKQENKDATFTERMKRSPCERHTQT